MATFEVDIRSLTVRIADKIEFLISTNEINPGDQLPSERELATLLGVGRSTIRESIKILISRNVLEIRRGTGTFVCESVGVMDDPLGFRFVLDQKKLALDLNQVRMMVEPQIASLAATTASPSDVVQLQTICDELTDQINNHINYAAKDIAFHTKLAQITDNMVIPKIIPTITQGISLYVDITDHKKAGKANITHQAVVDAIKNHDAQAAYDAMVAHLAENRKIIESLTFPPVKPIA